ncbi:hypothetical protein D3C72_2600900 [compost metagenome]
MVVIAVEDVKADSVGVTVAEDVKADSAVKNVTVVAAMAEVSVISQVNVKNLKANTRFSI